MKVKYRIVIDVESDTERECTPDRWDFTELMDAPAELISYEEIPLTKLSKKNAKKKKRDDDGVPPGYYGGNERWEMGNRG